MSWNQQPPYNPPFQNGSPVPYGANAQQQPYGQAYPPSQQYGVPAQPPYNNNAFPAGAAQPYGYPTPPPSALPMQQTFGLPPPPPPVQQHPYAAGSATQSQPMWYLGTEVSPIEGMNMGMPLAAPMGYDPHFDAERIRKATKGFGTDEKTLVSVMTALNAVQMNALARTFEGQVGRSLVKTLESETRGWFEYGLRGLALGPLGFDCWLLHRACVGAGTHEDLLTELLLSRNNADMYLLKTAYRAIYNKDLTAVVRGELSMKTERLFMMALTGNRDETPMVNHQAVAHDVETLYRAGAGKIGTDEIAVCGILLNRSPAHLAALAQAYPLRHRHPLSQMVRSEFSGHMQKALSFVVAFAEADGMGLNRDAEMLEEAMRGMGTKDERLTYRLVRLHWERPRFEAIKMAYQRLHNRSLAQRVGGETSGDQKRLLLAIIQ